MKLPRDVDADELIKALRVLGYSATRQTGSHIRVATQVNGQHHEVVPRHRPIKSGTLRGILGTVAEHHRMSLTALIDLLD
jgi:predicted RNA binding protein YcfA (HicA-like mRNA interferase family)